MTIRHRIRCPHCGAEYVPSEIFMGDEFLESPISVTRDSHGRIVVADGKEATMKASYNCDYCNRDFDVTAKVSFSVEKDEASSFDEETSIAI